MGLYHISTDGDVLPRGSSITQPAATIHVYKHYNTRHSLNLSEDGRAWLFHANPTGSYYSPIPLLEAITAAITF